MNPLRLLFLGTSVAILFTVLLLQAGQPPKTGPATEKRFPPLKLPPGFKATLFACDPLIEYPSVISVGPRAGAVFVACDFVSGLGPEITRKSEIRLVEDTDGDGYADKATVVAKDFNSIQGITYHNDTLFVMHAPFLTALRLDKKAKETDRRKDLLTGLGLPPEKNPSRLHCANGVTIGHDGWLYLAQGDNGVNVPRPEGDRLVFNGGGILRCRLDGRDLHVFSTGLRNIYDIALDAELNVFTRDNENDGGTYMIRVCHCFHGSDHGYPYDYYERPDHAMKPIGDFGLGSSAGGVCYLETQFPKEYRGNLFFCEWGKSVVRYDLKRAGTGFAPVKEIEFAVGDPKDPYPFKPTDVVVQRDGSMMVSDYADGQRPKRGRGRIYHIAYVGQDSDLAKKPKSDLEKLNSESYFQRWEAQIAFERRGDAGRQELGDAFRANKIGPLGMSHALQALSKGRAGTGLGDMLALVSDPDPTIRLPAIRIIADLTDPVLVKHKLDAGRGDVTIAKTLATLKKRDDPRVLREIVIALGRLRWAESPAWLAKNLTNLDPALEHAAMQTMRRSDNWPAALMLLDQPPDSAIRRIALRALADRHETLVVDGLIDRLKTVSDQSDRRDCANLLTRVYKKPAPWKYWGYRPGPRPANTEVWERTDAIEQALDTWLANVRQTQRESVLKMMQREKVPVRLGTLEKFLRDENDPEAVAVILAALSQYPAAEVRKPLDGVVRDAARGLPNRLKAIELLLNEKNVDAPGKLADYAGVLEDGLVLVDVLRRLSAYPKYEPAAKVVAPKLKSGDPRVRAAAIEALGELRAPVGRESVVPFLADKDARVRRAAAGAAGKLGVKDAVELLLKIAGDSDVETRGHCLDSLRLLRERRVLKFASAALSESALELKAIACFAEFGTPADAKRVVDSAKKHPSTDVVTAVVRALTAWRDRPETSAKEKQDLYRSIAEIHGAGGILVHWDVSVPYNQGGRDGIVKVMGVPGKRTKFWHTQFSTGAEGRLTLEPIVKADQMTRYLFTEIDATLATPVEFLASSRSTLDVWLNGKPIHHRAKPGKFLLDSDRFPATLQPGMNRILLEAGSADTPVEFHLRFRRKSAKAEHEKFTQAALSRTGNAERGRKLFFDKEKSQCIKCHQLGNQGERIGPELTGVGNRFSRIYLVESILEPSRTIAPSFGSWTVTLKNGKQFIGVKLAEDEKSLTLADNQGQKKVLARAEIDEQNASAPSTMPEGLELRMTEDEFVDLIAFLASQKELRK